MCARVRVSLISLLPRILAGAFLPTSSHVAVSAPFPRAGELLAQLLSGSSPPGQAAASSVSPVPPPASWDGATSSLGPEWGATAARHLESLALEASGELGAASEAAEAALTSFSRAYRETPRPASWVVSSAGAVARRVRAVAELADAAGGGGGAGSSASTLRRSSAADALRRLFAVAVMAPGDPAKKLAALDIANVSIKMYFSLGTLRLARNLVRTVDSKAFPPLDRFPTSQVVTYRYHLGRLFLFEERYDDAEENLAAALGLLGGGRAALEGRGAVGAGSPAATAAWRRNRERVLRYLGPLRLACGRLPSARAAAASPELRALAPLAEAVRAGDVARLDALLAGSRALLVERGTYLLLERVRALTYRRCLRVSRTARLRLEPGAPANQLPLRWTLAALRAHVRAAPDSELCEDVAVSPDELECVVAHLVHRKYVRGYISHKNQVLVLSKQEPFPEVTTRMLEEAAGG